MQIWKVCLFHLVVLQSLVSSSSKGVNAGVEKVDVGVILDMETRLGKVLKSCICMGIQEFYSKNTNYTTLMVPHFRNSSSDVVSAASAAIDLLKNTQVAAIWGPQRSIQADFVIGIGDKVKVPIISPASSPSLSPQQSPYFIRSAWSSAAQAKPIAELVRNFNWREVVIVYEDNNYGSGLVPFLTQDLLALVSNLSVISPSAENDAILENLHKLKVMQTRVFIVHMLPSLASRFFKLAKGIGMMEEGYVWIIADVLTSLMDYVDSETVEAMQGVVGVKAYYPRSDDVRSFTRRWRKWFHGKNPEIDRTELNVFGLWAYDSIAALGEGIERVGSAAAAATFKRENSTAFTDLEAIGISTIGPSLAAFIKNFTSKGLSGDFNISNGELQPSAFEIVNVIGKGLNRVGFWTENHGISKNLKSVASDKNLGAVVWPGQVSEVPIGVGQVRKIRVAVPAKNRVDELVKIDGNGNASGFCIDVFEEVMRTMKYRYGVDFEYVAYQNHDHNDGFGYHYDELVDQLFLKKFDAVVADLTITANRSLYVDFTFPYIESGVSTAVLIVDNKNAWIFMKPLTMGLWLTIGAFFIFTGFVVWALEHRVNEEFRGPPLQQVGMIFWFSFSTLVFAHKEKVTSNLSRFVVVVWLFVVLVLTSSYTASLTSMLTVQQLEPADVRDLTRKGECVGYKESHLVKEVWDFQKWDTSKLKTYTSFEEYDEALTNGSRNGGVGAVMDNLPSIRLFLSKYCHKYTIIGPTYKRSGFGFAFQKGSPLTSDVSRAIMQVKESGKMDEISKKWFGDQEGCSSRNGTDAAPERLNLDHFKGLFMISGISSLSALAISIFVFIFKNRHVLASGASVKRKLHELAGAFDRDRDDKSSKASRVVPVEMVSANRAEIIISFDEGMFSQFVRFSSCDRYRRNRLKRRRLDAWRL